MVVASLQTISATNLSGINSIIESRALTKHIGNLHTDMRGKPHDIVDFALYYSNGTLQIPKFKVGKMPGSIQVSASGIKEGTTQRFTDSVFLTILGSTTKYDANILVTTEATKLKVVIDVIDPIYDGASFIAHVVFTEK